MLEALYFGGAIAMTVGPLLFLAAYTRPFWGNRKDPIAINVELLGVTMLVFGLTSLLARFGLLPHGWTRPLLVFVNWSAGLITAWRAWQVWALTRRRQDD